LVEVVGGQWLLKLMMEVKVVPGSVVKRKVQDQLDHIEATTGRKPGKKEKRELTDDARLALLPMAFSKQSSVQVWVDPAAGYLLTDAGSQGKADEVITWLIKAVDGLVVQLVNTVVRYTRHALDTEEVTQHIAMGKVPTRLALTWSDRVSFVLTEALQLKKLAFLESVFEGAASSPADGKDDNFDADVTIATGELRKLIPDLIEALGGEMVAA
jgi:recombination associated protein RdgC